MAPERRVPDDPLEWLNRAKSNLVRAKADIRLSGIYLEDLCFDAQQAAEKAIKAVLIRRGIRFRFVHDLTSLLTLIEREGSSIPETVKEAGRLTRYAVAIRYPGHDELVTLDEYERAVAIAETVLKWAEEELKRQP
jgi:HEPN domain-containing protein